MFNGQYCSHSKNGLGNRHLLDEHLISAAEMASRFTAPFYRGSFTFLGWMAGLLHDLGKCHPGFQEYLKVVDQGGRGEKVPHSPWGAALTGCLQLPQQLRCLLGLIIYGHHSGLTEPGDYSSKISTYTSKEMLTRMHLFLQSLYNECLLQVPRAASWPDLDAIQLEMLGRMVFSALLDADRLDTEAHFYPEKRRLREKHPSLEELAERLKQDQKLLLEKAARNPTVVNRVRKEVYEACLAAASKKPGFYRLTVPTGGGKTRSSLAYALEHAIFHKKRRIIFVLPYTSIIDQNARVYREILGSEAVLEHHSQTAVPAVGDEEADDPQLLRLQLAEENWDLPVIVTTTVQLLESLFSNKPSRCRKIHRIADSVLIFDEAQTLPPLLLKPTLDVLKDLVENYGTTVVLSTATQPAFNSEFLPDVQGMEFTEIVPDYQKHFELLKRVEYCLLPGQVSLEYLAEELAGHEQVLVIMNTRKEAIRLVDELVRRGRECFHLSTLLCGAHRRVILDEVRRRLDLNKRPGPKSPLLLVSTQVVEAGVDLDFPLVYRAVGPLDRIVQAAGRCNREGRAKSGLVKLFILEGEKAPSGPYKAGFELARVILSERGGAGALNYPDIFKEYFSRLFNLLGGNLDKHGVQELRAELNYPAVAEHYRLIESDTVPVLVKYGEWDKAFRRFELRPSREEWRQLQPYIINIFRREAETYLRDGLITDTGKGVYLWEGLYDETKGISGVFRDPADLII